MGVTAKKKATYEDLSNLPENMVGEIILGELVASPRPSYKHAHVASSLGMDLGNPFQKGRGGPGGWWILDEPEVHLGENVLVPDLSGWKKERLPKLPEGNSTEVVPDWVCEVVSPSTARADRVQKMPIYAEFGVPHLWLIDPIQKTLEVYVLEQNRWVLLSNFVGDDEVKAAPFSEVVLGLGSLWVD